ncbi:Symplekin/Pta1 protein [Dioscorea alata]|uniref:Symplekin/Pta1 protein n=1 Tax=Dioscorea alata TaxID=55571 RepID=A0ACB7WE21_DIOAL|nr:Symplekin/Pta1 protein [Dioscorea alata]
MGHNGNDAPRVISLLKELGGRPKEESLGMVPILLSSLKSDDPRVVTQSIISGTSLFCAVLEEMALQLHNSGQIGRWLEEIWAWMVKFKDAVSSILFEPCSLRAKMLAVKFLEICVLLLTSDVSGGEVPSIEGKDGSFNISQLVRGHSVLTASVLANESNKALGLLMEILQLKNGLHGSLKIVIINCLAAIAKNRPDHYSSILSALLNLDPSGSSMGGHPASIRYSLRTAFLGFLRCTNPSIVESRERLLRALQAMNPGETAEQLMRHVEKMSKNLERSRDIRPGKDDSLSGQAFIFGDSIKKRHMVQDDDYNVNPDGRPAKRTGFIAPVIPNQNFQMTSGIIQDDNAAADEGDDDDSALGGFYVKASVMDSDLAPLNEMINMIVALRAERERGNRPLDILVSRIEADLLADLVIECMKNLPIKGFPLYRNQGNVPINSQASSSSLSAQAEAGVPESVSVEYSALSSSRELTTAIVTSPTNLVSDLPSLPNISSDVKRDPRRDPRRLDPRRTAVPPSGLHSLPLNSEENNEFQSGLDHSLIRTKTALEVNKVENPVSLISKSEPEIPESPFKAKTDVWNPKETSIDNNHAVETVQTLELQGSSNLEDSATQAIDEEPVVSTPPDVTVSEDLPSSMVEADPCPSLSTTLISEDICHSRRTLPPFIELIDERRRAISKLAIMRIIGDQQSQSTSCSQARLQILARLVSLVTDGDDILTVLQQKMSSDYYRHKGHELAIKILYQLFTIIHSEFDEHATSVASSIYDNFLLSLARSVLDSLPSSDKSFGRLLAEAPYLPHSVIRLLEDLCHSHGYDQNGKDTFDGDRVTQGLGAVWSLILGRPLYRQACLDIALKCAVDSQDEVRAKAVRLVANKLYPLDYASEHIEHFAKSLLLSVVDQRGPEAELKQENSNEERKKPTREVFTFPIVPERCKKTGNLETSFSPCENTEVGVSGMDSTIGIQSLKAAPISTPTHVQHQTPLFFALCSKKPSLLQLVFDLYGGSPKAVKQSVHRHLPALVRTLGPSYSEILHIVSNPPEGSEDLIMLVLDILTENVTPAADLVAAVKHLYETKLKDAAILIPMLSSFSKDEVLPIFPQLVGLPLEKFQMALARILQGSAHTGPALTPVEVLVAIHGIVPEKDGIALRKITDACTACFEQRTVFTQQVLAKSLNLMVEQVPLPLLFMRTIIQAIDAFPNLVDFVMGILSKLVGRQVWKMPKLWPGFMKCLSQTPPHSYNVLLQDNTESSRPCQRHGAWSTPIRSSQHACIGDKQIDSWPSPYVILENKVLVHDPGLKISKWKRKLPNSERQKRAL